MPSKFQSVYCCRLCCSFYLFQDASWSLSNLIQIMVLRSKISASQIFSVTIEWCVALSKLDSALLCVYLCILYVLARECYVSKPLSAWPPLCQVPSVSMLIHNLPNDFVQPMQLSNACVQSGRAWIIALSVRHSEVYQCWIRLPGRGAASSHGKSPEDLSC